MLNRSTTRALLLCTALSGLPMAALAADTVVADTMAPSTVAPVAALQNSANMPAGFSVETNISQTFSYDSNPLRLTNGATAIYGSTTSPELIVRSKTPTSVAQSDLRVDANAFDHSAYDSADVHEKLLLGRQNERWDAHLDANFDYDTTRTSELNNYDINLPRVHSTRFGAAPQVSYHFNENNSALLYASAIAVSYDNRAYTDYNFYQASPGIEHRFDPQNTGNFTMNVQRYETAEGPDSASNSYGPSLGWTSLLTPRMTLHASAGALNSISTGANKSTSSDNTSLDYVFSGDLAYTGTVDSFDALARRAHEPFGNGTETLLDTFSLTGKHALNEKLALTGEAKYQIADYPDEQPRINLDHGYVVGTGLTYKVMDDVDLSANYKYLNQSLTAATGTVEEHVVMLGFNIRPSWSRN